MLRSDNAFYRVFSQNFQSISSATLALILVYAVPGISAAAANGTVFNGALPGAFSVSPTGAAIYNIHIEVPPGIGGMTPQLSLNYNSQAGNGLLGVGWSLGGLSAITRCPATLAQDGFIDGVDFDANDRFCLDGQRLIQLASTGCENGGTEYRTEIDSYARVCSYGTAGVGPSWFKVWTKAGLVMEYGHTADSKIEAQGKASVMVWAVNLVMDTSSNNYKVTYIEQPNHYYSVPFSIDYTANNNTGTGASYRVLFDYEVRPDAERAYVGGSLLSNSQRLQYIRTYTGPSLVGEYRLTYSQGSATGRSLLDSVKRCDGSASNSKCADATSSVYGASVTQFDQVSSQSVGAWADSVGRIEELVMDVNADGRADLVRLWMSGTTMMARPNFSVGNGFSPGVNSPVGANCNDANCNFVNLAMDVNGDGKTDLVRRWSSYPTNRSYTYTYLSTGTGFGTAIVSDVGGACIAPECNIQEMDMEMDGDGRSDLVRIWKSGTNAYALAFHSNGSGFVQVSNQSIGTWADNTGRIKNLKMDVDGDGRSDIVRLWYDGARMLALPYFSTGTGFQQGNNSDVGGYCNDQNCNFVDLPMDVNGDGKTDLVRRWRNGTSAYVNIYLSDGTGFVQVSNQSVGAWCIEESCEIKEIAMDVNGDGKEDLVRRWKNATTGTAYALVYTSNGTGFDHRGSTEIGGWCNAVDCRINEVPMDVNGDGKTDLVRLWRKNNGSTTEAWALVQQSSGIVQDRLASINPRNGQGVSPIQVQYSSLTDSAIYTKNGYSTYPFRDLQMPMYVVKEYSAPDGKGGLSSAGYSYAGLKLHLQGRGLLGFRRVTSVNHQTGIITGTFYNQDYVTTNSELDFPRIGAVDSMETTLSGSTLSSSTTTYSVEKSPITKAFSIFPESSIQETYELNGTAPVSTVTTTNSQYDAYGNPGQVVVDTGGGYTKTTTNTYTNDTVKWFLGRLINSTVTSVAPSGTASRASSFEYDPAKGLLTAETIEPIDTQLKLRTEYAYDAYGNKSSVTVKDSGNNHASASNNYVDTSIGVATSTSIYDYSLLASAGTYTITNANAKSQSETQVINARFGVPKSLTGPNGLTTTWTYDSFGRKKTETRADGTTTTWGYLWCGSGCAGAPANSVYQVIETNSSSTSVTVYFDSLGREIRSKTLSLDNKTVYKDTQYNNLGQVTQVSRPYFSGDTVQWTKYEYDDLGRVVKETAPDTSIVTTTYAGLTTSVTRASNQPIKRITNVEGNLVEAWDEANKKTTYTYDPFGNLKTVKDPVGNTTTMYYDKRGRKTAMDDPDMGHWEYKYDALGQLRWQKDAKNQVTTMTYDVLGRMTSRVEPEGTSTWIYDKTGANCSSNGNYGKLCQVTGPNGYSETYTYDALGRPSQTSQVMSGNTFSTSTSYDTQGRVDTLTYHSGFLLKHYYNNRGYLASVCNAVQPIATDPATVCTTEKYWTAQTVSADGQITKELLGNGLTTERLINVATGRMTYLTTGVGTGGTGVQNVSYQYDALGNLKERMDVNQQLAEAFTYDVRDRLSTATINGVAKNWTYDDLGNIKSKDGYADYTYGTAGTKPHAVTAARGNFYSYDNNGNLTGGGGRTITWNSANLPTRITKGSAVTDFSYGPDRARYKQVSTVSGVETTTFYVGKLYEQSGVTNGSTVHKNYIHAAGRVVAIRETLNGGGSPTTKYLHQDHLGSTDVITSSTGQVLERQSFDAFGTRRVASTWNPSATPITSPYSTRGYTGHEQVDPVGLIHMNGRVYDAELGRFISADPTVQAPGNGQSLNRYSYVWNNPLAMTDPSGFFSCGACDWVNDNIIEPIGDAIGVDRDHFVQYAAPILAIAVAPYAYAYTGIMTSGSYGAMWTAAGAASGFTYGGVSTGTLEGAIYGGMTGASIGATIYGGYNLAMRGFNLLEIASQPVGSWGGPDIAAKMLAQDIGHEYVTYKFRREADRLAERNGLPLWKFNLGLMGLSAIGNSIPIIGSRYHPGDSQIVGVNKRGISGWAFDAVDTVLEYQGIPSASGWHYILSSFKGQTLQGHSLGALTVSNLIGIGFAPINSQLNALPFPAAAPGGVPTKLSTGDLINGSIAGRIPNPGATYINGALGDHDGCTLYGMCAR